MKLLEAVEAGPILLILQDKKAAPNAERIFEADRADESDLVLMTSQFVTFCRDSALITG
jgi:hypothetical protein